MTLKRYRNPKIATALKRAVNAWTLTSPRNGLPLQEKTHILGKLKGLLVLILVLFLILMPVAWMFYGKEGPYLMSLLIPGAVAFTFSILLQIKSLIQNCETSNRLPLNDALMNQECRSRWLPPFLKGLFIVAFWGLFMESGQIPLLGMGKAVMVFLGLFGFMPLVLYSKSSWAFRTVYFGPMAALFLFLVIQNPVFQLKRAVEFLPWYQALAPNSGWMWSFVILSIGAVVSWLTRKRWTSISPHDRTRFFELYGSSAVEVDEEIEQLFEKNPRTPVGALEKIIWGKMNSKEQALARAVGFCKERFLNRWLKWTFIGLALIFLGLFDASGILSGRWHGSGNFFTDTLPAYTIPFILLSIASPLSMKYLGAMPISSQTLSARFVTLPYSLATLEKITLKEGLIKWLLISMSISMIFTLNLWPIGNDFLKTFPLFFSVLMQCFPMLILIQLTLYWNQVISDWVPKKSRGAKYYDLANLIIILQALLILAWGIILLNNMKEYNIIENTTLALAFTFGGFCLLLILRFFILRRVGGVRYDLIREVDSN